MMARVALYLCLVVVNLIFIVAWVSAMRARKAAGRPAASDVAIGCGTSFLDSLGIGNYAQITALFKFRGHPADELIPGTLNVGNAVPAFVGTLLFATAFDVDPVLLSCMV